jgi:(1->4)-alpha-D-glucan 1-alpha-D-glucosylmutase
VLSEIPGEWRQALTRWRRANAAARATVDGVPAPDANEEYLLYQTLLGAWPLAELEGEAARQEFVRRVQEYMLKAMREAKVNSSWLNQNVAREEAVSGFIESVLNEGSPFLSEFRPLKSKVAWYGMLNSLSMLTLKLTSPGVPDTYQGQEVWDFSLVDPDNRRPVDYKKRQAMLAGLVESSRSLGRVQAAEAALDDWRSGRPKLLLTWRLLGLRRECPELFQQGDYNALDVRGPLARNCVVFLRRQGGDFLLVAVPRLLTQVAAEDVWPLGDVWQGNDLVLPAEAPTRWRNVVTGEDVQTRLDGQEHCLPLSEALRTLPVAALLSN